MSNIHVLGYTQTSIGSEVVDVLLAGFVGLTPLQAASTMFDAIKHFTVSYPTPQYLTLVKIVIFDVTIVESFRQCFLEPGNTSRPVEPVYPSSPCTITGETTTLELGHRVPEL